MYHYAEPLVSLDLDLVLATEQLEDVERLLADHFAIRRFPHSLNIELKDSDLRVQIRTDPRYGDFLDRAGTGEIQIEADSELHSLVPGEILQKIETWPFIAEGCPDALGRTRCRLSSRPSGNRDG